MGVGRIAKKCPKTNPLTVAIDDLMPALTESISTLELLGFPDNRFSHSDLEKASS